MQIASQDIDGVTVVRLEGHLDTGTSLGVQDFLDSAIDGGASKLLVNFEKVEYVSSAGLRVLLFTTKRLNSAGGSLRVCGLNETVTEVFEISGFSTILDVSGSEEEALGSI